MKTRNAVLTAAAAAGAGYFAWSRLRSGSSIDLHGKIVFITGGSRGLGLQLAREYGSHGAIIAICARNQDELDRAKSDLTSRGVQAQTFVCDVSNAEQVKSTVDGILGQLGHIDVLVNNAGIIQVGPISEMTIADFERAMGIIFWGTLYASLAVLPAMRERRRGSIVNITSIGAKISLPHLVPYSCAKFATLALSEGLRAELAPDGVRVTTIVPGLMRTGSHLNAEFKGKQDKEYAWFSAGAATPLVSIGAERAARAIVRATIRGDAEKILSVPAQVLARVHGLFPGLSDSLSSMVQRLLPTAGRTGPDESSTGAQALAQLNSRLWEAVTRPGQRAAESLNQL